MTDLLTITAGKAMRRMWFPAFIQALEKEFGKLTIVEDGQGMSDDERAGLIRQCRILLTGWGTAAVPASLAHDRGRLEYICNVTGTLRSWIPVEIIEAGIPVTNWGDLPAAPLAEGAMALFLTVAKNMRWRIEAVAGGANKPPQTLYNHMLKDMQVGVYGCGVAGRRFIELLRPWGCIIQVYDPYVTQLPEGCRRIDTLDELFAISQAVIIHAGLSPETEKSVTAARLAKLPDYGLVINTARGDIIDQAALFAELEKGRLWAGLDVLAVPENLPPDHPARRWPNLVWTCHDLMVKRMPGSEDQIDDMQLICLDNLRRHASGQPLRFTMDRDRYLRST
ncbi:MAG: NAD(P)-dependent oxidoreductase [Phycisphaeraceae bacterium]